MKSFLDAVKKDSGLQGKVVQIVSDEEFLQDKELRLKYNYRKVIIELFSYKEGKETLLFFLPDSSRSYKVLFIELLMDQDFKSESDIKSEILSILEGFESRYKSEEGSKIISKDEHVNTVLDSLKEELLSILVKINEFKITDDPELIKDIINSLIDFKIEELGKESKTFKIGATRIPYQAPSLNLYLQIKNQMAKE